MSIMYLMSGPSGAGKTTFAKKLAEDRNLQYLGIDDFYAVFNGSEKRHEDEFDVWMAFFQAIHLAELKGRNIVVDTNSPTKSKRTEFLDWFGGFDQHVLIFVNAPVELCVANNLSRERVIPEDAMNEIIASIEHPLIEDDPRWDNVQCYMNRNNTGYDLYPTPTKKGR